MSISSNFKVHKITFSTFWAPITACTFTIVSSTPAQTIILAMTRWGIVPNTSPSILTMVFFPAWIIFYKQNYRYRPLKSRISILNYCFRIILFLKFYCITYSQKHTIHHIDLQPSSKSVREERVASSLKMLEDWKCTYFLLMASSGKFVLNDFRMP